MDLELDQRGGRGVTNIGLRDSWKKFLGEEEIIDVWRESKTPDKFRFTWKRERPVIWKD